MVNTVIGGLSDDQGSLLHRHAHGNFTPGMIRLIVKEVAKRAGIKNPRELSKKANLPYESCRLLWEGNTKMIGLNTIEHLCTLFEVPPCQLFDFEADPSVLIGELDE